jgi:hypothetical protein
MSNTLIAWAAFYPVLRSAFCARPGGAEKLAQKLDFHGFGSPAPAARPTNRPSFSAHRLNKKRFLIHTSLVKTAA